MDHVKIYEAGQWNELNRNKKISGEDSSYGSFKKVGDCKCFAFSSVLQGINAHLGLTLVVIFIFSLCYISRTFTHILFSLSM